MIKAFFVISLVIVLAFFVSKVTEIECQNIVTQEEVGE